MEYKRNTGMEKIQQNNLNNPKERERILMQYGGIFKNNIREYAEVVIAKQAKQKNYAR